MLLRAATIAVLLEASSVLARVLNTREATGNSIVRATDKSVKLSATSSKHHVVILDYGQNYEGHPAFEVVSSSGDTSGFELTFAESRYSFSNYMSDGPLSLAGAMDTYRVNHYNISKPGVITNRLVQGAFRYQKLNLSSTGQLTLKNIGVKPTVHTTPLTDLPGSFECSDPDFTRIWYTGARTAQLTEIPKNSIPDFWQISNQGAFIESSAPQALSAAGAGGLSSYQVEFEVKPVTGEFVFSVLSDTLNDGILINVNVDAGIVSSTGSSGAIPAKADVRRNKWLSVKARVNITEISVSINNQVALKFSQTSKFYGSFGLGAPFRHSAYYRNLKATALDGTDIYSSSLKEPSVLKDFLLGTNPADTIIDGSRRDRIAYSGDLDISLPTTFASTYGKSFVDGSIALLGSFQAMPGFFIPTAKIQQLPLEQPIDSNVTGLIGYSFNLLTAMAKNYEIVGDIAFAKEWAPRITDMLDWAHSKLQNELFTIDDPSFVGDWNYYDPPQTGASSKFNALYAYTLQQTQTLLHDAGVDTAVYQGRLKKLRKAIHSQLWNSTLQAYVLTKDLPAGFAQDANALAILAGIPQSQGIPAKSLLSTLEKELQLPAGPLAFTNSTAQTGFAQKISPYSSAYHLRAAFESDDAQTVRTLLKTLWAPMANPAHTNYTNCFWETLNPDGTPGLGLPTSLCHGWGAGPTAELSRHVLGVQAVAPGFGQWRVEPMTLGLNWAKGRVPTEHGPIHVEWKFVSGLLQMKVRGPKNSKSSGVVYLPRSLPVSLKNTIILVNGKASKKTSFKVSAGGVISIRQVRA